MDFHVGESKHYNCFLNLYLLLETQFPFFFSDRLREPGTLLFVPRRQLSASCTFQLAPFPLLSVHQTRAEKNNIMYHVTNIYSVNL